jgi:hypothetical protein
VIAGRWRIAWGGLLIWDMEGMAKFRWLPAKDGARHLRDLADLLEESVKPARPAKPKKDRRRRGKRR